MAEGTAGITAMVEMKRCRSPLIGHRRADEREIRMAAKPPVENFLELGIGFHTHRPKARCEECFGQIAPVSTQVEDQAGGAGRETS